MNGIMDFFRRAPPREKRARPSADLAGRALYVVGDVHGCMDELLALERNIIVDAKTLPGRKLIVMLGDYVDRGPASSRVIDHIQTPPAEDFERICLAGNHEVALLDYLDGRLDFEGWLGLGAEATIRSYGLDLAELVATGSESAGRAAMWHAVPGSHVDFLRRLPVLLDFGWLLCVHAGLRAGIPIKDHSDDDLVWLRPTGRPDVTSRWVVHGHTPVARAECRGRTVNVDTGAFYSGRLSALRVWSNRLSILSNLD